jgi:hypothetical protein
MEDKLTRQQQKSLHLWFSMLASELNQQGITMQMVLKKFIVDAPCTKSIIKELVWKPVQDALYAKTSTTELLKKEEIDKIYDTLNKFFAEELQVQCPPFPSLEEISLLNSYEPANVRKKGQER